MDFNFASSLSSGPAPFLQECSLKDCTVEVMEGLPLSSVSPYDFIPFDLSAVQQGLMSVYLHVLENVNARSIAGAGIIAAAVVYGVWKTSDGFSQVPSPPKPGSEYEYEDYQRKSIEDVQDSPGKRTHAVSGGPAAASLSLHKRPETRESTVCCRLFLSKSTNTEELSVVSETVRRQLHDAMSRLDDVLYKLKELQKDKELLSSEIDVRKQMIHKLQVENTTEREKRQKAELKIEIMGMENSQIRQLRKEIDLKSGQVEKLETLMKEKDDMQMKLFENNIVLPRNVVEARAREFSELQNRVLHLQAEIDSSRRSRGYDMECQPCGLSNSVWLENALRLPALQPCETKAKKAHHYGAPLTLSQSFNKKLPNTKLRLAERSPRMVRQMSRSKEKTAKISRAGSSPSMMLHSNTPTGDKSDVCESKSATNTSVSPLSTPGKPADLRDTNSSMHRKNVGVFAQIRALVGNFRHSNTESNSAHLALLEDLGSLLHSDRQRNNRLIHTEQPFSDEQSSVFMSASGGSDGSDIDEFGMHCRNARKSHSKKLTSLKRLSKYRRGRRRDNIFVKRRLAVQYFDGQAHLIGVGEPPDLPALPRQQKHRSLVKQYPITVTSEQNKNVAHRIDNNLDSSVSAIKICDTNNAHKGDSWILIIPQGT